MGKTWAMVVLCTAEKTVLFIYLQVHIYLCATNSKKLSDKKMLKELYNGNAIRNRV